MARVNSEIQSGLGGRDSTSDCTRVWDFYASCENLVDEQFRISLEADLAGAVRALLESGEDWAW